MRQAGVVEMYGPLIDDLWQTGPGWPAGEVRVLPDGGVDLIWDGASLVIAGPDRVARLVQIGDGPPMSGVRLLPGAARSAFGVPGEALVDAVVPAVEALGADVAGRLANRLAAAPADQHPRILAQWATSEARSVDGRDRAVAFAAARLADDPTRSIRAVADDVGYSERQLRRRVQTEVGYSPKRLARILRLRRVIGLASRDPSLTLADAAYVGGFADQAHLGHECMALGGATAGVLLAR
ncbi:MAG: helix-turn-helix domain-containing protein [Solirubrobacteraceae bacterium]|nr:helix-turn-helix domain-containing protein [Solirubrobacteraceae bacterium]